MSNKKDNNNSDDEIAFLEKMLIEAEDPPESSSTVKDLLKADLADSSDEEEARDCQSSKYNSFGKEINKKLKENEEIRKYNSINVNNYSSFKPDFASLKSSPSTSSSTIGSQNQKSEVIKRLGSAPNEPSFFCDPIFGLRIINPLISSATFKDRMSGKIPIGVQRARFHTEKGDLSKDWVIAGVLVTKSPTKTTQKGDAFSIWSISDLRGEIKYISLFLFKSAHKELWKTNVGSVIGILNPRTLDRKDDKIEAALSIDNAQKMMILGQSKDLGKCRAKKANGEICDAVINKTDFEVCIFHMKKEYNSIKRTEFKSGGGFGLGMQELRNKVLGKSEVFYAGQSFSAVKAKKPAKMIAKDRERLTTLSEYYTMPYNPNNPTTSTSTQPSDPTAAVKRILPKAAASIDTNFQQRKKDLERLKLLQGTDKPQIILTAKKNVPTEAITTAPPKVENNPNFTPKLSKDPLTFSFSMPTLKKNDLMKQKAAAILKKKPLEISNPNLIKYRGTEAAKRKINDEMNTDEVGNENKKIKLGDDADEKKRKEFIQRMMNATSSHMNLVEAKETEIRDKCLDSMEKKEAMEERMANTMEMKCKAVICKKCKYIYFSASEMCKQQRHELKVVDACKRFYQCGDCKNRTVTLFKIPRDECKNCRSRNWKRTGMMKSREAYVGEALSVRGDEELFIGSSSNANINLLVADE